jgi:WD40 repeat protein
MNYYKIGGSLKANHPTYVTRQADRQILELLIAKEYCFVFNSRQMGKSSLRIQAIEKLKALDRKCATLDLTLIGGNLSQAQWYKGIARQLLSNLELDTELDFDLWWQHQESWTYEQKLQQLIEQIILPKTTQNIIIFIDEVDRLIGLDFKDDFFAFMRACYNQRAENSQYDRLTFCLLGVTTPADLIQDKQRTPFNIGFSIELTGLTFTEAKSPLIPGLQEKVDDPEAVLKEVLKWTGGQPFLTQKLCHIIVQKSLNSQPNVAEIVLEYIIKDWEYRDEPEHLRTIRDRLLNDETKAIGMLGLYQRILHEDIQAGSHADRGTDLRLSGLVVKENGYLKVYSSIYKAVFHENWIEQQLDKLRPYSREINNWLLSPQDPNNLLTETSLNEARNWAIGRSLSDLDYQFFDASQKRLLELETAEKETQIQANQILTEANQKAHRIIRRGGAIAIGLLLLFGGGSLFYAQQQLQVAREAQEGTRLLQVVDNANRLSASRQLEALILAMQAGQDLNKLMKDRDLLSSPQAVTTLSVLLNILVKIREVNQLKSDREQLNGIAFSPDGKIIVAGSDNGSIKRWQRDGTALNSLSGSKAEVNALSFSPNGEIIASGDAEGTIRLWHRNGTLVKTFQAPDRQINDLTFSPNGQIIASGGSDRIVKLWQPDGTLIRSFPQAEFEVKSLSFSPNNRISAVGLEDGTIQLRQLDGTSIKTLNGHRGWVTGIAFSPNGQIMASSSDDGTVKLWKADGTAIASLKHPMRVNGVIFSPKGDIIASVSDDRAARLWKLDGTLITTLPVDIGQPTAIAFSSDGEMLAATTTEGIVKLWDANLERNALPLFHGNSSQGFNSVDFTKDGRIVLVGDRGTVNIWQPDGSGISGLNPPKTKKIMASVGLSQDGTIAAFGMDGGTVELQQQGKVKTVSGNGNRPTSITFSPDGEIVAVGNDEGTIKLWKPDGTQIASFPTHQRGWITSLNFSPDGKLLASGSDDDDSTIKLWKLDGTEVASFLGHTKQVNSISFSPNGQIIASGSSDRAVKLWKLDGSVIDTLRGHSDSVNSVSFSPNGQIIASGSEDGTIKLWQADGTPIATLKGGDTSISSLTFSDDGKVLATASRDGTVILWDLDLDRVLAQGCRWLQDYLRNHPETLKTLTECAIELTG